MDFKHSEKIEMLQIRLLEFMEVQVYPNEKAMDWFLTLPAAQTQNLFKRAVNDCVAGWMQWIDATLLSFWKDGV